MAIKKLTLDQKRQRLLEYMVKSDSVFLLKELEKSCPEKLGIVSQTVKEVLESLVNDNLVEGEKVGISTYFWIFPSKEFLKLSTKTKELDDEIESLRVENEEVSLRISNTEKVKGDSEEREILEKKFRNLSIEKKSLEEKIGSLTSFSIDTFKELEGKLGVMKDMVNVYTDNVFELVSRMQGLRPDMKTDDIYKHFGIPEDFDNL